MEYTPTKMSNKTNVAKSSCDEALPVTDLISTLPNEIKVMICDGLTARDVARTSRCSRHLNHLGNVHEGYLTPPHAKHTKGGFSKKQQKRKEELAIRPRQIG